MRAERFVCSLDVLYRGLKWISKLQFLVIKALDQDWIRIRIGIQPKMLDPDPDEMNADPQPCLGVGQAGEVGGRGSGCVLRLCGVISKWRRHLNVHHK